MRELPQLGAIVGKLFADAAVIKWPAALAAGVVGYLFPTEALQTSAVEAGALILIDTLTGMCAAKVSGQPISSARFSRALVKVLGYASVVAVVAIAHRHVPGAEGAQSATVTGVLTLVIATEAISVLENVRRMGLRLPAGLDELIRGRMPEHETPATKDPTNKSE